MDCAKGVAARMARPEKSIREMKGVLKIRRKTPLLFAVPTTAGTGSETTIAAVFADNTTHEKFAVIDSVLLPGWAVLDPVLTERLPEHITAATGMDALTHAVEAYIGKSNTKKTKEQSRLATKLIFENMLTAYSCGDETAARQNMLEASYLAGMAFTRAYLGNVHAMAHALGGLYSIPHGLANAVILPRVLEAYGSSAHKSLAELADLVGLTSSEDSEELKSSKFIEAIINMNQSMGIPEKFDEIKEEDMTVLVNMAFSESNPLYPVPRVLSRDDFRRIYLSII